MMEPRETFPLPAAVAPDKRADAARQYAIKVWRMSNIDMIQAVLENLYEQAYSAGLKDMDSMHSAVDATPLQK